MLISTEINSFRAYGTDKEVIKLLKDSGFSAYDFSIFRPEQYADENCIEKARELRAFADSIGILCNQTHAPFASVINGDEAYNQAMFPNLVRAIEISGVLGAKVCVVHPCNDYTAEENKAFYESLAPYAEVAGVKIGVENMWNWYHKGKRDGHVLPAACSHQDDFKKHMDLLDKTLFCANVDIGHAEMMHAYGTNASKMIETLGEYVQAIHLHDVDFWNDNHSLPFTQSIDFEEVIQSLEKIGYAGDITLEADTFASQVPKELLPAAAKYAAEVANYFKNRLKKL